MSDIDTKFFVQSFIRFLNTQLELPHIGSDSRESLEVAIQCLENVYEITQEEGSTKDNPLNHINLFEVYRTAFTNVTPERKAEAEVLKNEGNRLMKEEKYQEALNTYSRAIALDATNPVFYCNRAASFNRLCDYKRAADDCRMALRYDPNYSKAYGRLGLAYSKMNRHDEALEAYRNALRIEPDNQDYKNNMSVTEQRLEENRNSNGATANLPNLGGIDLAAAFNNPALVSMATRMIGDPAIQNMMSGMNSVEALLESCRNLATQMTSQNPELFANMIRQMEQSGMAPPGGAATTPNAPGSDENNSGGKNDDQPQPPSDSS